jgi:hypothetical protein
MKIQDIVETNQTKRFLLLKAFYQEWESGDQELTKVVDLYKLNIFTGSANVHKCLIWLVNCGFLVKNKKKWICNYPQWNCSY